MRHSWIFGLLLGFPGDLSLRAQDSKAPLPASAEQRKAEKILRNLFKDGYSKKAPADRRKLAAELLKLARENKEAGTDQYILFSEAGSLAAKGGDLDLAFQAVDELGKRYAVDPFLLKQEALAEAGKSVRTPDRLKDAAYLALKLADEAVAADVYDTASKALDAARSMARRAGDPGFARHAAERAKAVSDLKKSFGKIRKSAAALAKDPEDGAANLAVGRFRCFVKAKWERGLPLLAKGSDAALKALAEKDLAGPKDAAAQVEVAGGWYERAGKSRGREKLNLQIRSRDWYKRALPGASILARVEITKRLKELEAATAGAGAENILLLVDPKKDSLVGTWRAEGGSLITAPDVFAQLEIPYVPPDEYDLTLVIKRLKRKGIFLVGLAVGDVQWDVVLDGDGGLCSFHKIGKDDYTKNETVRRGSELFPQGKNCTVVCSVRRTRVVITVDGEKIIDWKADYTRILKPAGGWKLKNKNTLYLGSIKTEIGVSRITLTPRLGQGRRLR